MMAACRARVLAVASACVVAALPARAIADPAPSEARKQQQASELVKKAIAKSQAKDHAAAIELYLEAHALVPAFSVLLSNVGAEYQAMGRPAEALAYFCKYIEKDRANAAYAITQARQLQAELGRPDLGDDEVCAPAPRRARAPPAATEPATRPRAAATERPAPGRGLRVAGLGLGVGGAAVFGAGVYYGVRARRNHNLIENHDLSTPWTEDVAKIQRDGQRFENRQILFMVAGGTVLVTGAVLYYLGHRKRARAEVTLTPTAAPGGMGVVLGGRF